MNSDSTSNAGYQVNDKILLFPEHVDTGVIRQVVYGNVEAVNPGSITVKTRKTSMSKSTVVVVNTRRFKPSKVATTEFNGLRTGTWLRKAVLVTTLPDVYLTGQVVQYTPKPAILKVRTKQGTEEYRVEEVMEVPGPLGILLFNANYTTETRLEEVAIEILLLMQRIQGCEDQELIPSTDLVEIFADICPPPPDLPVTWINPLTGMVNHCTPQHAVNFLRWEADPKSKPTDVRLGPQFSQDPTLNTEPINRYLNTEGLSKTIDYLPVTLSQPKPSSEVTWDQNEEETKEEVLNQADEFSAPSEGDREFSLDDDAISQNSNLIDDMIAEHPNRAFNNVSNLRDSLGIKKEDGEVVPKNKLAFYPSNHDRNMFRALFARRFHTIPAMAWCENLLVNTSVKFLPTPAKIKSLYRGKHGIGGVIGADFEPMHKRAQKEWFTANPSVAYNFGADAKVIVPKKITTFLELKLCYDNQVKFFKDFGSPTAIAHFLCVYDFVASLDQIDAHTPAEVAAIAEWLDNLNQIFMTAVSYDLQTGEMSHLAVSKRLTKSDPELQELKREVVTLHYHELMDNASNSKRKKNLEEESPTPKKKKAKAEPKATVPAKPSDGPVLHLLPLVNGKQVCLRHLSKNGCHSKHPTECTNDTRIHHVPEGPLPKLILQHMKIKWNGVSDKYPQLSA